MTQRIKNPLAAGLLGGLLLLFAGSAAADHTLAYCDVPGSAPIRIIEGVIYDLPIKFTLTQNTLKFSSVTITCYKDETNRSAQSLGFKQWEGEFVSPGLLARFKSYDSHFIFTGSQTVNIYTNKITPPGNRSFWFIGDAINEGGTTTSKPVTISGQINFTSNDDDATLGVLIRQGEPVLTLPIYFESQLAHINFTIRLVSDSALIQTNTTCAINDNQQISVAFNTLRQDLLTTDTDSAPIRQEKALSYRCPDAPGWSGKMNIMLVSDNAPFSANYIKTTNQDIGVALLYQGKIVKPNEQFQVQFTNGGGGDNVAFVPVKNNVPYQDIATGDLTGTAALVLSLP